MFDQGEVFIRKAEAARRFGVQIRTLERWEKAGLFPRRVQIGPLAVGYRASELQKFAESRQYPNQRAASPEAA
jgi:predicted DNA-binding transcriptional regulator AlpA